MKKLALILLLLIPTALIQAAEDGIRSIHMEVFLNHDGSAHIVEVWDIDNVHDGTEYFIPMNLPKSMTVHSLQVHDESERAFEPQENWDVDASFEEKAFRSGIIPTRRGYELAWGISQFGDRTFTVSYVLENLVQSFADVDGIPGHVLVGPDMSSTPALVTVTISADFPLDSSQFQVFGGGFGEFVNGDFLITAESPDFVTIRSVFAPDQFAPAIFNNSDFDDFQISGRGSASFPILLITILGAAAVVLFSLAAWEHNRYKLSDGTVARKPKYAHLHKSSLIPQNGNVPAIFKMTGNYDRALGTYLLLWYFDGYIEIGKKHLLFLEEPDLPPLEAQLYYALKKKANDQGKISSKKVAKWLESSGKYQGWLEDLKDAGTQELLDLRIKEPDHKGKLRYTKYGFEQLVNLWSYEKYLKDFDGEAPLRNEDFVLAVLLGLDDSMKGYNERYPHCFNDDTLLFYTFMWTTHDFNRSTRQYSESASSTSSTLSSGGGFSGGGGGGGSR